MTFPFEMLVSSFPAYMQIVGTRICECWKAAGRSYTEMLVPNTSFLYRNEETTISERGKVAINSAEMLVPRQSEKLVFSDVRGNEHLDIAQTARKRADGQKVASPARVQGPHSEPNSARKITLNRLFRAVTIGGIIADIWLYLQVFSRIFAFAASGKITPISRSAPKLARNRASQHQRAEQRFEAA